MTKFLGDQLPPQFVDISANTAAGMVATEMKTSMVIAGRGARACDMCGKERARWYCAADEAYLCERCDESVHSANAVAKRHERARIGPNGAPLKVRASSNQSHKVKSKDSTVITGSLTPVQPIEADVQKWCNTSRKRSRSTRRCANVSGHPFFSSNPPPKLDSNTSLIKAKKDDTSLLLFDLLSSDDRLIGHHSGVTACEVKSETLSLSSTLTSKDRPERKVEGADFTQEVPIYEPLLQDLIDSSEEDLMEKLLPSSPSVCDVSCGSRASTTTSIIDEKETFADNWKILKQEKSSAEADENLQLYDLVDSSAGDMNEGISVNEDSDIDTFDVMDLCSNANFIECVKMEEVNDEFPNADVWNSKYRYDQEACVSIFEGNPFKGKGERDLDLSCMDAQDGVKRLQQCLQQSTFHRPLSLHLDFEEVMNAWSDRGSLWLDGQRPQVVPDISLISHGIAECGMIMMAESNCNSSMCSQAGQVPSMVVVDKGREARVLRYKEKRRTRLFSKRIRYEVRKLNAERRPRMKGRFVKRAAAIAATIAAM